MSITFPNPSVTTEYTDAGITWDWNPTLGVWSKQNQSEPVGDTFVTEFGAVGDGVTDDTAAIQTAINAVQGSGRQLVFPNGTYKLSSSGNTIVQGQNGVYGSDAQYALIITQAITINAVGARFTIPVNDPGCHCFVFQETSGGVFSGGYFEGVVPNAAVNKSLFRGAAVAVNISTGVSVENITCKNLRASCQMYDCDTCQVSGGLSYRTNMGIESGTFYGSYSGRYNLIENCTTYGGCNDGDMYCYGSGYGNRISKCKSFNSLYGDSTYAILSTGNQGLGLDSGQDAGTVSECIAYGSYYGIDAKGVCGQCTLSDNLLVNNKVGLAVRPGEVNQDVSGHTLITNNTVIPNEGNGNTNNNYGYTTTGIELNRCPSVTIEGNFIGVEASIYSNNSTTKGYNFASIAVIVDPATLSDYQPCDINIANNRFQNSAKFGPNQSYCTGPMIFAYGYWTGNANNKAQYMRLLVDGNTFTPYTNASDGKVIYYDGFYSITHSNNIHCELGSGSLSAIPYVEANNCLNFIANGNSFDRHGTAFDHSYPPSGVLSTIPQLTLSSIITSNSFGGAVDTSGTTPACRVTGDGPCIVSNNSWYRVDRSTGPFNEGPLISYNYTTNGTLMVVGNVMSIPQTFQSFVQVNGTPSPVAQNICLDDNIINGSQTGS